MKKALITGIAGQDGSYLAELLLEKGYQVFGFARPDSNLKDVSKSVQVICGDMADKDSLLKAVQQSNPDEVYNLGGISDLKTAFANPELTMKVNYEAVGVLLNECIKINPKVKFLQASSSEIFVPQLDPLEENSPRDWETKNPYAKAKMLADRDFIEKAQKDGIFACSAILFNHESPRRLKSVTTKIVSSLKNIREGKEKVLLVGNINMKRDWGYAKDYVEAMWSMLQLESPRDFVVATGKNYSIKYLIDLVAQKLNMKITWLGDELDTRAVDANGQVIVEVSKDFYKPDEKYPKVGKIDVIQGFTGWKPRTSFEELVNILINKAF